MKLLIKGGRVLDPASGTDAVLDILASDGVILAVGGGLGVEADRTIDASGLVVAPGFIDMHVHLREPGYENKETILTGSRAAARGGFTTVCCMPNTRPANDGPEITRFILAKAAEARLVSVRPIAAVTRGLGGVEAVDMEEMVAAGAVAFSDDGHPVAEPGIMRGALLESNRLGTLVIDHCEDKSLSRDGCLHEGPTSRRLGLKGIPAAAEETMVVRDIRLARETGARVHIAHLSVKGAVHAVEAARSDGVRVSVEATPHHLLLTDASLETADPNYKMNPPLRGEEDREALVSALRNGVIDVLATDHAPHSEADKNVAFDKAPFGVVGLETAVPLILDRLVGRKVISLSRFIELSSVNPAKLLGFGSKGRLAPGADADFTILSPGLETIVEKSRFESKGRNTPFQGWKLKGGVAMTIVAGRVVYPFDENIRRAGAPGES
jgi:dihydroorotase